MSSNPVADAVLKLGAIADRPDDDEQTMLQHRFLIYMGVLMSGGGLLWGGISLAYGLTTASVIPFGYVFVTAINLIMLNATKKFGLARNIQVVISLLLPFLFQWALGGFVSSGAMMLWAMLALCGSLTFSDTKQSVAWLGMYAAFTIFSGVIDPYMREAYALDLGEDMEVVFLVINFTVITSIVFGLMIYLTAKQKSATAALQDANSKITELNAHLEDQVAQRTQQLRSALAERQAILDNLVDGLVATDAAGNVNLMNPALQAQFGLDDQGVEVEANGFYEPLLELLDRARSCDTVLSEELPMPNERIGQVSAAAVVTDDGEKQGVVALVRDVTLEKEVDRMKTDFIATVSHEMRTPLTSVMGFAKITGNKLESRIFDHVPDDDKKAQRAMEQIRKNMGIIVSEGERLTALINDVLDISKMEAGRMEWSMAPVDTVALIERAASASHSLFADKDTELVLEIAEDLPALFGDHDRLLQVLLNLISNASKFTDEGTVTLGAMPVDDGIELYVRDTGDGISPANQELIFEKFRQVGDTLTNKPMGTGLGLPICRQIVEAHEGQISVQSALGQGSTFRVVLPVGNKPETPRPIVPRATPVPSIRPFTDTDDDSLPTGDRPQVLVVDDDTNLRELLRQQLTERGYDVRTAINGNDAIAKIRNERPAVVVLDVKMPDLSGYDVAAMLRNDPETESIPIMMLSILEDRERGIRVGVDHHMMKPADPDELAGVVGQLAGERASHRHVLVIDDRSPATEDFARLLASKGFHVESADPAACVEVAKQAQPDLILLDGNTGSNEELVRAIRYEKGLEHVLIMQLTDRGPDGPS